MYRSAHFVQPFLENLLPLHFIAKFFEKLKSNSILAVDFRLL